MRETKHSTRYTSVGSINEVSQKDFMLVVKSVENLVILNNQCLTKNEALQKEVTELREEIKQLKVKTELNTLAANADNDLYDYLWKQKEMFGIEEHITQDEIRQFLEKRKK
jgi:cell division protein FtsB